MAALTCLESFTWLIIIRGINPVVLHWTWISGAQATWSPSSHAMKVARASAGRPIRALWVIRLARGIKRPRNPF